jgi:hypothetical protein
VWWVSKPTRGQCSGYHQPGDSVVGSKPTRESVVGCTNQGTVWWVVNQQGNSVVGSSQQGDSVVGSNQQGDSVVGSKPTRGQCSG